MLKKCNICGREFKNLKLHVLNKHKMSLEDYEKQFEEEIVEMDEPVQDKVSITGKDKYVKPFNGVTEKEPEENPISSLLKEFGIDLKELRSLLKRYVGGDPVNVTQEIERKKRIGEMKAEELKDRDEISISLLNVAEELVNKHGFTCYSVTSNPKTYHLRK